MTSFPEFFDDREEPEEPDEEPEEPDEDPEEPEEEPEEPDEEPDDPDDELEDLLDCAFASGSPTTDSATEAAAAREMTCVRAVTRIATRFTNV